MAGRVAVVTGCNTGIGKKTVLGLARLGMHVVLVSEHIKAAAGRAPHRRPMGQPCCACACSAAPMAMPDLPPSLHFWCRHAEATHGQWLPWMTSHATQGGRCRSSALPSICRRLRPSEALLGSCCTATPVCMYLLTMRE